MTDERRYEQRAELMQGDGKWRTQCVGDGARPFVVWRVVDGKTEYHRTEPCNFGPCGRIIRYTYEAAHKKAQELNATAVGAI